MSNRIGYFQILRQNKNYRKLWLGSVVSQIGDWFSYVAVLGMVWKLTGSGMVLALTMISRAIPYAIAGMVAGVLLDRRDRKKVLITCDVIRAALAVGYIFIQSPSLIWMVYLLGGAMQSITAFFSPGVNAYIPSIVSKKELPTANALQQSTNGATMVLGSAIGGAIVALIGRDLAFLLNGFSYLFSAVCIYLIQSQEESKFTMKKSSSWEDFKAGVRFLLGNRVVLAIVLRRIGERLGAGFNLLISVFAISVWHTGEPGIGFLYSIIGIGLIVGGFTAKRLISDNNEKLKLIIGFANMGEGVFWLLFCLSPNIYLGAASIALMVGSDIVATVCDTTLMQRIVPNEFLGRMFSARETLLTLSWSLALAMTGIIMDHFTPQQTGYGISGMMLLTAVVWLMAYWTGRIREQKEQELRKEMTM